MSYHRGADGQRGGAGRPAKAPTRYLLAMGLPVVLAAVILSMTVQGATASPRNDSAKAVPTTTTQPASNPAPTTTTTTQPAPAPASTPGPGTPPASTASPTTLPAAPKPPPTTTGTAGPAPEPAPAVAPGPAPATAPPVAGSNLAPAPAVQPGVPAPPTPAPTLSSIPSDCSGDVSATLGAYLDSLPPGATFASPPSACYLVNEGLKIIQPLTIMGGTFRNDSTTRSTTGYGGLKPVIKVYDTTHVTLAGLLIEGANLTGTYHAHLDTGAGVKIISSSDVTLTDITTQNTFGDGLELVGDLTNHIGTPVSGLVVNGFSSTNAGRQGVTLADVFEATLTNVHIVSPADGAFDFESDEAGMGSGYVAISDCTYGHVNLAEYFTGPITFTNCTGGGIYLGSPHSMAPITFFDDSLSCQDRAPKACIVQYGGSLTISHTTILRRQPDKRFTEPVWSVHTRGRLAFVATSIVGSFGWQDLTSAVTFGP